MKKIIIGILVTFLSVPAFARTISGTVVDEKNLPLQAASIVLDGSDNKIYATTNSQGQFTLTGVPEGTVTITVQYTGYKTEQTKIKERQNSVNIELTPEAEMLEAAVTTRELSKEDVCTENKLKELNASSGDIYRKSNGSVICIPKTCLDGYDPKGTGANRRCEDKAGTQCQPNIENAKKSRYERTPDGKLICPLTDCDKGYRPNDNKTKCIQSDGDCTKDQLAQMKAQHPNATKGQFDSAAQICYPSACDSPRYSLTGTRPNTTCEDNVGKPCKPEDMNADKTEYAMSGNKLICQIKSCKTGYTPSNDGLSCIPESKVLNDGDHCKPTDPHATAGKIRNGTCYPTECEGPRYVLNEAGDGCKDMLKESCTVDDTNAKKTKYEIRNNKLVCIIQTCTKGYIPDDNETKCIKSEGACKPDSTKYPNATAGELIKGVCYPTACANGYDLKGIGARNKKCEPIETENEETTDTKPVAEPRLSKEESQQKIDKLQENYDKVKENEQSWANKGITAASMGTTGIGASMALSALSEQNADAAAERDMKAYLATFRCTYGTNQVRGGEKGVFLPGGNVLLPLYTEYVNLADSLKERKNALGMMPGIESEVIIDKSTAGLYDDELMGKNNGTFISLADAFLNPTGESAQAWAAQQAQTAETLKAGLITAGAGIATGIIGNAIVNRDAYKDRSDEIERQFALLEQMETEINNIPPFNLEVIIEEDTILEFFTFTGASTEYLSVECPEDKRYYDTKTGKCVATQTPTTVAKCDPTKNLMIDPTDITKCKCMANYIDNGNDGCECPDNFTDENGYCAENSPEIQTHSIELYSDSTFDHNKYEVREEAKKSIEKYLTKIIKNMNQPFKFIVIGYTDTSGKTEYNIELGQLRADAVKQVMEDVIERSNNQNLEYTIETYSNGEAACRRSGVPDETKNEDCRKVKITYEVHSTDIQQPTTQQ